MPSFISQDELSYAYNSLGLFRFIFFIIFYILVGYEQKQDAIIKNIKKNIKINRKNKKMIKKIKKMFRKK